MGMNHVYFDFEGMKTDLNDENKGKKTRSYRCVLLPTVRKRHYRLERRPFVTLMRKENHNWERVLYVRWSSDKK